MAGRRGIVLRVTQPLAPLHVLPAIGLTALACLLVGPEVFPMDGDWEHGRWALPGMLFGMSVWACVGYLGMGWLISRRIPVWWPKHPLNQMGLWIVQHHGRALSAWAFFCRCSILAGMEAVAIGIILASLLKFELTERVLVVIGITAMLLDGIHLLCQLRCRKDSFRPGAVMERRTDSGNWERWEP